MFLSIAGTFQNVTDFGNQIFDILGTFISFIITFLSNIPSYFKALIDFFITYVVELPLFLITIFGELPIFVQTGLIVLIYALYIAFVFRLIKLIIPFLQK